MGQWLPAGSAPPHPSSLSLQFLTRGEQHAPLNSVCSPAKLVSAGANLSREHDLRPGALQGFSDRMRGADLITNVQGGGPRTPASSDPSRSPQPQSPSDLKSESVSYSLPAGEHGQIVSSFLSLIFFLKRVTGRHHGGGVKTG